LAAEFFGTKSAEFFGPGTDPVCAITTQVKIMKLFINLDVLTVLVVEVKSILQSSYKVEITKIQTVS